MMKTKCRCEACGKIESKMELHESGQIKNKKYVFKGFYFLCHKCHDIVHCIQLGSMNRLGPEKRWLNWIWKREYKARKYGSFKTKAEFDKHIYKSIDQVFEFMMADSVDCDYSRAEKYGLDPDQLRASFHDKYNHFECRIKCVGDYICSVADRGPGFIKAHDESYSRYAHPEKAKKWHTMILGEYLRHEEFYKNKRTLYNMLDKPERKGVVEQYAKGSMRLKRGKPKEALIPFQLCPGGLHRLERVDSKGICIECQGMIDNW